MAVANGLALSSGFAMFVVRPLVRSGLQFLKVFLVSKTEQGGLSLPKARFAAKCPNIRKRAVERQARAEVAPVKADRAACAIPPRAATEDRSPRRAQWSARRRVAQLRPSCPGLRWWPLLSVAGLRQGGWTF